MDIQFCGANCIIITTKQARLVIDDNLESLGQKSVAKPGDIILFTHKQPEPVVAYKLLIDQPGEYEVSGVSVYGISARAHMDEEKRKTATMFKIVVDEVSLLVTGHVYPELNDSQLESIGSMIDVMLVPVGGNGYTLDGIGALKLVKKIEPKVVVPTHYEDEKLNFEVPQQPLEQAYKSMAMEPKETLARLKPKVGEIGDTTQLVVLERV